MPLQFLESLLYLGGFFVEGFQLRVYGLSRILSRQLDIKKPHLLLCECLAPFFEV
ncbi:MAG: hypothetical protein IPJ67_01055 [Candidatus Moraniibacteriota bacterium]|nr:MAG: hypothetical protein IPJ67_01055 [Candidatus Moranbacteria bacterium]